MIRLYIENNEMDVTEGFSHQITYAVDDLQNLDSKATAFSKTIVLPGTAKNNYLLGNIFEFGNANFTGDGTNVGYNFNASKSAKCRLEINGLQIIKGVLRLLEIVRDGDSIEYEVAIFGELGGFINNLGTKKLQDLDFSIYNHLYTVTNIQNSWTNNIPFQYQTSAVGMVFLNDKVKIYGTNLLAIIKAGDNFDLATNSANNDGTYQCLVITYNSTYNYTEITIDTNFPVNETTGGNIVIYNADVLGVYYPLIDYGNYSTDKRHYKVKTFRPAIHVYDYVNKIIKDAGYTWESDFFESDFFKRLIIPHAESRLLTITNDLFRGYFYGDNLDNVGDTVRHVVDDFFINKDFGASFSTSDNKTYTYSGTSSIINFNFQLLLNIVSVGNNWNLSTSVYINGSPYHIKSFTGNDSAELLINYTDAEITLNNGDTFSIHIDAYVHSSSGDSGFEVLGNGFNINYKIPEVREAALNDNISMNTAIPKNILQKDFFASIIKMFYLMVTEDKYKEKHLIIKPWTWFYDLNVDSYLDWTMKLDRSQPIRIKPMSEANARYYDIKFKSDSDYYNDFYRKRYNEGYGDVRFDNQLEFAKDASTTEVIFSATPLLGYQGKDKIVPTIFKWTGSTIGQNEDNVNSNIRILQKKLITEITSWNILGDTGNTLVSLTQYPYAGHFDDPDAPNSDINFGATKELFFTLTAGALGNNLFNTFYSSYLAEITDKDSRLVTAKFKLNDTDIFNLDFGKFIYLDGVLYRLSRVVDYTPGEICTVELLRVIYTTYDNSVNASDDPEVVINGKTWKVKNLDTEYYNNGDPIPQITDDTDWENATEGAWCYYANQTANGIEYGKLYNWYAVTDARGIAPDGWDIPTETDLTDLADYTEGSNELKEVGTTHWNQGNGTDEFGFKALGAGRRRDNGAFDQLKTYTYYWTKDEYDTDLAYYGRIQDTSDTFTTYKIDKNYGFSIRLIKQ